MNVAQEQSLECPDNDEEILLNGKLVIGFQENKILMAFSQLLKINEILVGLPMPCMCHPHPPPPPHQPTLLWIYEALQPWNPV